MDYKIRSKNYGIGFILIAALCGGCSLEEKKCGGKIHPENASGAALEIANKALIDSREYCRGAGLGCDLRVAKTSSGWTVAVVRKFSVDGVCASRVGDEKFYSYDNSGNLIKAVNGI